MRIKNQERIMAAVKKVLAAEDQYDAVLATVSPKRKQVKKSAAAMDAMYAARAELRIAHREIVRDEYGE
jgi:hypothetical protein